MISVALPQLREELALHIGPRLTDGQPSWTLQDPVRNRFFRLDWLTFEILAKWDRGSADAIVEAVCRETPLDPTPADIVAVAEFLISNELVAATGAGGSVRLAKIAAARQSSWLSWLIHNYLFFRLPLLHPDRFLRAATASTRWLFGRSVAWLTGLAFVLGLALVYRQWDAFAATLVDSITPQGVLHYAATLIVVKTLHEFGHGIVARRYGCRVPAMGIAFMVLWPMPYTDVNEAWKLPDRRARALIGAAGVITELAIAVWATFAWALLEDGAIRNAAFLLASTTWVSTLFINLSPFMRFDGYFVLSDLLDMPNLHARSFAMARWALREWLLGLGDEAPEIVSRRRCAWLIIFACVTMIYRLSIFLGVAFLVYAFFIKIVGIVLFAVEILYFILLPIFSELRTWPALWPRIRRPYRASVALLVTLGLVGILFVPIPWTLRVTGVLRPGEDHAVYAPEGARIDAIHVRDGQAVAQGAVLFDLSAALLDERLVAARSRLQRVVAQVDQASVTPELRNRLSVLQAEMRTAQAALRTIEIQLAERRPIAPRAGRIRFEDPDLRAGTWVGPKERLATVIDTARWQVEAYVGAQDIRRLAVGTRGSFHLESRSGAPIALELVAVDRDATRVLSNGVFAHLHGGSVTTRESDGRLIPEQAVYRVLLLPDERPGNLAGQTWRGRVVLFGAPESLAARAGRAAMAVLWREAGW
jgi:putative peptide zinc metalloprotease protein